MGLVSKMIVRCPETGKVFELSVSEILQLSGEEETVKCPHCGKDALSISKTIEVVAELDEDSVVGRRKAIIKELGGHKIQS